MRISLRNLILPLLVLAPLATGFAGDPGTTPLDRALATIDAKEISADLHFLASDELRGRDTPSAEQRVAARFIASRLGRLGFTHGAEKGWIWEYSLPTASIDLEKSHMGLEKDGTKVRLALGEHYAFYPGSIQYFEVEGSGAIYAGTMSEKDREGLELRDHWLLVRSSELEYKEINRAARKGKAKGVIILPGGELSGEAMTERVQAWGKQAGEGRLRGGRANKRARPYVYLSPAGEHKLFSLLGTKAPRLGEVFDLDIKEARVKKEESTAGLENVVGIWPGSDPKLKQELIIVSAHYDHVGTNDKGEVYNGADDNGSGTSAVLALAEALTAYGPMRRSVMLMWVSGEEKGLLGSAAWTKDPYLPGGLKPVLNLNLDMVGRNAADSLLITPTKDHPSYNGLTRLAEGFCVQEGFKELGSADAYWSRSDHANFSKHLKIPVAFLFADVHEDYHKVTDTVEKINFDKIQRVARLVMRMLDGLQTDELKLD